MTSSTIGENPKGDNSMSDMSRTMTAHLWYVLERISLAAISRKIDKVRVMELES